MCYATVTKIHQIHSESTFHVFRFIFPHRVLWSFYWPAHYHSEVIKYHHLVSDITNAKRHSLAVV